MIIMGIFLGSIDVYKIFPSTRKPWYDMIEKNGLFQLYRQEAFYEEALLVAFDAALLRGTGSPCRG